MNVQANLVATEVTVSIKSMDTSVNVLQDGEEDTVKKVSK